MTIRNSLSLIDEVGRLAGGSAEVSQLAVEGAISRRLASSGMTSHVERVRMLNSIYDLAQGLRGGQKETNALVTDIEQVALGAFVEDVGLVYTPELVRVEGSRELLAESIYAEIAIAMNKTGVKADHKIMSRVAILMGGKSAAEAIRQVRIEFALHPVALDLRDTTNRSWSMPRYLQASMRSHALRAYVETYLTAGAALGLTEFEIYHESAEHDTNGMVIDTTTADPMSIFHPNFRGLPVVRLKRVYS